MQKVEAQIEILHEVFDSYHLPYMTGEILFNLLIVSGLSEGEIHNLVEMSLKRQIITENKKGELYYYQIVQARQYLAAAIGRMKERIH